MNDNIVALDIGASKVSAAVANLKKNGEVHIEAYAVEDIESDSLLEVEEAIKRCKERLETKAEILINNAYIGFPAGLCKIIESNSDVKIVGSSGFVTEKHFEDLLSDKYLPVIPEGMEILDRVIVECTLDYNLISGSPVSLRGKLLQAKIQNYVIDRKMVLDFLRVIEKSGISIERIIMEPLAIAALTKDYEHSGYSALLNVRHAYSELAVFKGEKIYYTHRLPLGGKNITRDISLGFGIDLKKAEEIKNSYDMKNKHIDNSGKIIYDSDVMDNTIDTEMLYEIISARVDEIIDLSIKELSKFNNFEFVNCIYIAGSGIVYYKDYIMDMAKKLNINIKFVDSALLPNDNPAFIIPVGIAKYIYDNEFKKEIIVEKSERNERNQIEIENNGVFQKLKKIFLG